MVRGLSMAIVFVFAMRADLPVHADLVFDLRETAGDVLLTGSGSIDLSQMTAEIPTAGLGGILNSRSFFIVGPLNSIPGIYRGAGSGSLGIGDGSGTIQATSGSGDLIGLDFNAASLNSLVVPNGYVSGAFLSGSATFQNQSFSSLGATPGTYTWTSGTNNIELTVVAVPEPGSVAGLIVLGVIGFGVRARQRGRKLSRHKTRLAVASKVD